MKQQDDFDYINEHPTLSTNDALTRLNMRRKLNAKVEAALEISNAERKETLSKRVNFSLDKLGETEKALRASAEINQRNAQRRVEAKIQKSPRNVFEQLRDIN